MGNNTKNIIEMNGNSYDAVSGAFLGTGSAVAARPSAAQTARSRSVDGFRLVHHAAGHLKPAKRFRSIKVMSAAKEPQMQRPPEPLAAPAQEEPAQAQPARKQHTAASAATAHAPQRATTLMRAAVAKPNIRSAAVIKAQTRTDLLASVPLQTVAPKISYASINKARRLHAERMVKSPAVSRYNNGSPRIAAPHSYNLVTPAAQPPAAYTPAKPTVPVAIPVTTRPVVKMPPAQPIHRPAPTTIPVSAIRPLVAAVSAKPPVAISQPAAPIIPKLAPIIPKSVTPPVQLMPANRPAPMTTHQPTEDNLSDIDLNVFDLALGDTKGRKQPADHARDQRRPQHRHSPLLRVMGASFVVLLLVGFVISQNMTSISLKLASHKAGVHAVLPAKQPAGFKFGFLTYKPGNVTLNFSSPSDGGQYNISQKTSTWDSQALLNNFVAGANSAYKTYQRAGLTVYLLSNDTATWVDSGVWYTVDGDSSLTSSQLLDVASNM